jgi:hypothetical protein
VAALFFSWCAASRKRNKYGVAANGQLRPVGALNGTIDQ